MTRFIALWCMGFSLLLSAGATANAFKVDALTTDLENPWGMAFLPDGRILVTEKTGYLLTLSAEGKRQSRSLAKLPNIFTASQGGLLDIALAPDFAQSNQLFLSYACGDINANSTCLASATFNNGELNDVQSLFHAKPDRRGAAHYGGRMVLLPDNTLLLTLGDGFDYREQAQNKANHLGKIVRLTLTGGVPTDNPLVNEAGAAAEIFTYGHRNVQGIVYDAVSGNIYSHEHGPKGGDELNLLQAGNNYGWPVATFGIDYTGARVSPFTTFAGMQAPLHVWTPSIAPAGMTLYRGELFPEWQGNIFVSALAGKALHRLALQDNQVIKEEVLLQERDTRIRDVRTGPDGAIYLLTDGARGQLLRLTPHS